MRDNHQALRQRPRRASSASTLPAPATTRCTTSSSRRSPTATSAPSPRPAYDLESTAVATHTELLGQLEGIDGAETVASILIVEARMRTVLADLAGHGDDLDALFVDDAEPLRRRAGRAEADR